MYVKTRKGIKVSRGCCEDPSTSVRLSSSRELIGSFSQLLVSNFLSIGGLKTSSGYCGLEREREKTTV